MNVKRSNPKKSISCNIRLKTMWLKLEFDVIIDNVDVTRLKFRLRNNRRAKQLGIGASPGCLANVSKCPIFSLLPGFIGGTDFSYVSNLATYSVLHRCFLLTSDTDKLIFGSMNWNRILRCRNNWPDGQLDISELNQKGFKRECEQVSPVLAPFVQSSRRWGENHGLLP